jgi:Ca-activated chloride channel family protein
MQIEVKLDRRKINHEAPGAVHLMVTATAPEVAAGKQKPRDLVIAIDVSSSMSDAATAAGMRPTKLELAKIAARRFVENLDARDRVGLLVYTDEATVLTPVAELTETHRSLLIEQIGQLQPLNGTNLTDGCLRSLSLLRELPVSSDRVRRVILFTDGLPSVGVTDFPGVMAAIRARLDGSTPITTIGFGARIVPTGVGSGGYDPELLTSIARESGGNFYHAEGADGILEAFALELGALRSVAATDVRLEIRPGTDVHVKEVLNDFTVRTEGDVVAVTIGPLYSGERQHLVIALELPVRDQVFPRDTLAASVRLTGIETTGGAFDLKEEARFHYVKPSEADAEPDPAVEEQRLRQRAAQAIAEAYRYASQGEFQRAAERVRIVRLALMRFGSHDSQVIVGVLQQIEMDVGDRQRFAAQAGSVRAASHTTSLGRSSSPRRSDYYGGRHTSVAQDRSQRDMDGGNGSGSGSSRPSGSHGSSDPVHSSRPSSSPSSTPKGPDKTSSRSRPV